MRNILIIDNKKSNIVCKLKHQQDNPLDIEEMAQRLQQIIDVKLFKVVPERA